MDLQYILTLPRPARRVVFCKHTITAYNLLEFETNCINHSRPFIFSVFVQERDAAKTACDVLRQERDRAVSDLAALLRDTDEIRREQSKSMEELKILREKIKFRLETDDRTEVVTSMDSAIDTDSCTVSNDRNNVVGVGSTVNTKGTPQVLSLPETTKENCGKRYGMNVNLHVYINNCVLTTFQDWETEIVALEKVRFSSLFLGIINSLRR